MENITNIISMDNLIGKALPAVLFLLAGFIAAKLLTRLITSALPQSFSKHHRTLASRVIYWGVLALFIGSALHQLGFKLSVLLGAAGIFSVAIGFASQTSASNLISGLFVLSERCFEIGDIIRVGTTTGEVLSIDLLSVKLRTFDNLFVRIPNETIIKSEVTTLTKFPIRRFDLLVGIAYKEDIAKARDALVEAAKNNLLCLDEPKPLFILTGFNSSSVDIQFSVWAKRENFLQLRNSMYEDVKKALEAAGIEIPFPHLSLYTGSVTKPLPITMVQQEQAGEPQSAES